MEADFYTIPSASAQYNTAPSSSLAQFSSISYVYFPLPTILVVFMMNSSCLVYIDANPNSLEGNAAL